MSPKRLNVYLHDHIFPPLGMKDTEFVIGPDQKKRLVTVHSRKADGGLDPIKSKSRRSPSFSWVVAASMARPATISPSCRC